MSRMFIGSVRRLRIMKTSEATGKGTFTDSIKS